MLVEGPHRPRLTARVLRRRRRTPAEPVLAVRATEFNSCDRTSSDTCSAKASRRGLFVAGIRRLVATIQTASARVRHRCSLWRQMPRKQPTRRHDPPLLRYCFQPLPSPVITIMQSSTRLNI
jgi:hypothetical protein